MCSLRLRSRERHGSFGGRRAVVDCGVGGLLLAGGQGVDLGLLLADHVEEAVLHAMSAFPGGIQQHCTHHLPLLLVLQLLVQLAQAGCSLVVGTVRASTTG